jgi:hypothetical protein
MPPLENTAQSYALQSGGQFQRTRAKERAFTLAARVEGTSWTDLHITRDRIINTFKIDAAVNQQPVRFWYAGGQGTVQIDAILDAGLEFGENDGFTEHTTVRFIAYDPFWYTPTTEGTSLLSRRELGSTNYIAYRDPLGRWGTMGVNGTTIQNSSQLSVRTILPLDTGTVLLGGNWGTIGGTTYTAAGLWNAETNRFGTLTGGTISIQSGPDNCIVHKMIRTPSGSVYLGGFWGTLGGTVYASIGQWNGAFGTLTGGTVEIGGLPGEIHDLAFNGTLFVGGNFLIAGGTSAKHIAQHVNGAWGSLTGGTASSLVWAIALGKDNKLYLTGAFSSIGGSAANGFAFWNGAYGTAPAGLDDDGFCIAVGDNGLVYPGGRFLAADNGSANGIAKWNGVTLTPLGLGIQNPGLAYSLLVDKRTGNLIAGGRFGTAGGVKVSDGLAVWNGAAWIPPDIAIDPGQGTFYALAQSASGTLFAGGDFAGTAYCASVTPLVNTGASDAYPVFSVRNVGAGTVRMFQLVNTLTSDGIYFNLTLQPGEEATLDLTPGQRSFTSSYRGNVFGNILPGSNIATWRLAPGTNYVSCFTDTHPNNAQISLYWHRRLWSADGGTVI